MSTAPPPIMPLPPPRTRVLRYLVASPEHAVRLFADGTTLRTAALDALTREGSAAVLVESLGGTTCATMPLANGHEVAAALAGVPGAVTFAWRNLPAVDAAEQVDVGPPSRDPSLAAVEVEVVRLRKVEAGARALLASLDTCIKCRCPTLDREGPAPNDWPICHEHKRFKEHESSESVALRALEALLASASEAAS